jgi:cysteine-rich repeat protein
MTRAFSQPLGLAVVSATLVLTGCLQSRSTQCGDLLCPAGTVCAPDGARCVTLGQVAACKDREEGAACTLAESAASFCVRTICTPVRCGDGLRMGTEACDDGNTVSCDGCSADCTATETCGNRLVECGEVCDDGNTLACDGCSADCRSNETCGNGLTECGEACDDSNQLSCDGCSSDCRSTEACGNGLVECAEQCDQGPGNSTLPNAACRPNCLRQRCGDGIIDNSSGEDCDGQRPAKQDCVSSGFYRGTLGCSAACRTDVSSCAGVCGDGAVEGSELCDGKPPIGQDCLDYGYDVGNLYCSSQCTPSISTCERLGFVAMESRSAITPYIYDATQVAPNELIAVGFNGDIVRFDGSNWSDMASGFQNTLLGVAGISPTNVYAVGGDRGLLHYDGVTWSRQDAGFTLRDGGSFTGLTAVWFAGPHDILVGGRLGALFRSDGGGVWAPEHFVGPGRIIGLWGSSPSDIFAVADGAIAHYDGAKWSRMSVPQQVWDNGVVLSDIWGTGPADVFAVGEAGTILHYDGANWALMNSGSTASLAGVGGRSPTDVYVVGGSGVILHFNGSAWLPLASGTTQDLNVVIGDSDRIIAMGAALQQLVRGVPTLTTVQTGMLDRVTAVWSSGAAVFAGSDTGQVFRHDSNGWADTHSGTTASIWSIWGTSPSNVYAVGRGGVMLRYDGRAWLRVNLGIIDTLNWVWGTGPDDIYVAGARGRLLHFDGTAWTTVPTGVGVFLNGVSGSGPDDVYVVGDDGTALHFDGRGWSSVDTGTLIDVYGVYAVAPDDVHFFLSTDGVMHFDGVRFTRSSRPFKSSVEYGFGTGPSDIYAVSYQASGLFHYNGVDWAQFRLPSFDTYNIWVTRESVYAGAERGQIFQLDRHCSQRELQCGDRWDNDCDGQMNCADSDCVGDRACSGGGLCKSLYTLACGTTNRGTTAGGSPLLERYGCGMRAASGQERAYRFVADRTGQVTIGLSAASADIEAIVLGTFASGGCDPMGACLATTPSASGTRQLTFAATQGRTYYVMVDGVQTTHVPYELEVSCP